MDESLQKEFYRKTFNESASGYDDSPLRFFGCSADHLITLLDLNGDERVLDVATGTGNVALRLARQLPRGSVSAVDFSSSMLATATAKAATASIRTIDFREMDMQRLDFPKRTFDHAVCSFGVFFVEDMKGTVEGVASVVKRGGSFLMSTFTERSFMPLSELLSERLKSFGVEAPPKARASAKLATQEQCRELFQSAGLQKVEITAKKMGYFLASTDDWWTIVMGTAYRGLVNRVAPERVADFKRKHLADVERLRTGNGIWLEIEVLYTKGIVL
jgi:ubiquinone/menaquinone biosynthesis C-methylase UbiE